MALISVLRQFNSEFAARIEGPTMMSVGEQDVLVASADALFEDLIRIEERLLVKMACAMHFAVWESRQYKLRHEALLEWLESTTCQG